MHDTKNPPLFGLDPDKPVVVIVDDSLVSKVLWEMSNVKNFPGTQTVVVDSIAGGESQGEYKAGALDFLFHPQLKVAGLITDNNFQLAPDCEEKSTTRIDNFSAGTHSEEQLHKMKEGAAGIMLLRLIKGGQLSLESDKSKTELGDNPIVKELLEKQERGELKDYIADRFADMPVVWNTATSSNAKIYSIEQAIAGKLLEQDNPRLFDEDPTATSSHRFDDKQTIALRKGAGNSAGFTFIREMGPKRLEHLAEQAGKKPDAEVTKHGIDIQSEPEKTQETKRD